MKNIKAVIGSSCVNCREIVQRDTYLCVYLLKPIACRVHLGVFLEHISNEVGILCGFPAWHKPRDREESAMSSSQY